MSSSTSSSTATTTSSSSSTPSCLDLDMFRTIEHQVLSEHSSKPYNNNNNSNSPTQPTTAQQSLTRESHPHLQVNHRHNIVSYLTSRKRRTHSDLSIQSTQPVHRLFGIAYFEVKILCVKQRKTTQLQQQQLHQQQQQQQDENSPFRFSSSSLSSSTTTTGTMTNTTTSSSGGGGSRRPGVISIGWAMENYSNTSQPGWKRISYGYHSDDGMRYHNSGSPLGPMLPLSSTTTTATTTTTTSGNSGAAVTFGPGDIIGCGFHFEKREIFYTKNGQLLSVAFTNADTRACYATVGLDKASVQIMFHEDQFLFASELRLMREEARQVMVQDMLDSCEVNNNNSGVNELNVGDSQQQQQQQQMINGSSSSSSSMSIESELLKCSGQLGDESSSESGGGDDNGGSGGVDGGINTLCHRLIRQYLVHEGYLDTVLALDNQTRVMNTCNNDNNNNNNSSVLDSTMETTGGSTTITTTDNSSNNNNNMMEESELESLRLRSKVRSLIMSGETRLALESYARYFEERSQRIVDNQSEVDMSKSHEQIMYLMHSQVFIELVSRGQVLEAATYARQHLSVYIESEGQIFSPVPLSSSSSSSALVPISEVLGLLAYVNPVESPLGHLLNKGHVQRMATLINELLVQQFRGVASQPNLALKRIVSHIGALYKEVIQS